MSDGMRYSAHTTTESHSRAHKAPDTHDDPSQTNTRSLHHHMKPHTHRAKEDHSCLHTRNPDTHTHVQDIYNA